MCDHCRAPEYGLTSPRIRDSSFVFSKNLTAVSPVTTPTLSLSARRKSCPYTRFSSGVRLRFGASNAHWSALLCDGKGVCVSARSVAGRPGSGKLTQIGGTVSRHVARPRSRCCQSWAQSSGAKLCVVGGDAVEVTCAQEVQVSLVRKCCRKQVIATEAGEERT